MGTRTGKGILTTVAATALLIGAAATADERTGDVRGAGHLMGFDPARHLVRVWDDNIPIAPNASMVLAKELNALGWRAGGQVQVVAKYRLREGVIQEIAVHQVGGMP